MDNMRIEQIKKALQPQKLERKEAVDGRNVSKKAKVEKKKALELSPQAEEVRVANKALRDVADVREGRIRELERQIQQGQYKLIDDLLVEKFMQRLFGM